MTSTEEPLPSSYPTPSQKVVLEHETCTSPELLTMASGLGTFVHEDPFQISTSGTVCADEFCCQPTAMHHLGETHETPLKPFCAPPASAKLVMVVQLAPFHVAPVMLSVSRIEL